MNNWKLTRLSIFYKNVTDSVVNVDWLVLLAFPVPFQRLKFQLISRCVLTANLHRSGYVITQINLIKLKEKAKEMKTNSICNPLDFAACGLGHLLFRRGPSA